MSLNIDLYKDRLNAYNVAGKEGRVTSMKKQLFNDFMRNPSYFDVLVSGIERGVHIVTDKNKQYKVLCKPDENIYVGNYVVWEGKTFLCTSIMEDKSVQSAGIIQKCTRSLKFIDKLTNNLITKPAITSAQTLYTTGVKDEKVIEIPNGMVGIQFPYDEDTKKLDREDVFVFNKTKYKVTHYDETTHPNLIVLICTEVGTSTYDDKINEIADRWVKVEGGGKIDRLPWLDDQDPPIEPEIPTPTEPVAGVRYTLSIETPFQDDDPNELWYGETYKYIVHKFVDDVEVSGNFTFEISDATKATLSNVNNSDCKVTAKDVKGNYIIKLIVTDIDTSVIAIEQTINIKGR